MLEKDAWRKYSSLLDEALEMADAPRSAWLEQLSCENPEAAAFVRGCLDARERAVESGFLEGTVAPVEAQPTWIGRQVGPYTISALIEQGGMDNVWLANRTDGRFE